MKSRPNIPDDENTTNGCNNPSISNQLGHQIISAAGKGYSHLIKWFLDRGLIDADLSGEILSNASYYGHIRIVQLILENGGDVHYDGDRALLFAVSRNKLPVVKLLLYHGATSAYAEVSQATQDGYHQCLGLLMPITILNHSQLEEIIGIAGATAAALKRIECAQIAIRYCSTKYLIALQTKKSNRDYEENPGLNIIQHLARQELRFRRLNH
jgi:hypothetical protein